ncbi:MAG: ATP-binding protein [bacterium]
MKPFASIAIPHDDIIQGNLRMEVLAADLWQVVQGKSIPDYQNPNLFFNRTYLTQGLKNILEIAKLRLEGKTGDSIIRLETPFGGGKTHTLIALYHKAKEWNSKVVVLDGTALDAKEKKLWEEIEFQLTNDIKLTKGDISPGKESIFKLILNDYPVLILIDELLEYITKASGIKVGDSNLAAQTLAFIQELTGAVASTSNSLLVFTLPSSSLEHYDENTERIYQQLQKITGRVEKIYTPVRDDEIELVIRKRLFKNIDNIEAQKIVDNFVQYCKNEGLLSNEESIDYRDRFLRSYPFKPEVIDTLYKKWGSFPTFQRTRGVLRILSLVISELLNKNIPFIRLGDFNLDNPELKQELIKYIGNEWESIIKSDITSNDSGSKKVDKGIGSSYIPYQLGTIVSTTIFMMSFSAKTETSGYSINIKSKESNVKFSNFNTIKDIKIASVLPDFSSSVIDTVISNLREKLFYLSDEGLFFTNQPNLNRIIIFKEENISEDEIIEEEKRILKKYFSKDQKFKVYFFPKFSKDIPDNEEVKLIVIDKTEVGREFIEKYGETPRIYRNTLIFLFPSQEQKTSFYSYLRKLLALKNIEKDTKLNLSESQKKDLKNKIKDYEQKEYEELRKYYRYLIVPSNRNELKKYDMGIPTFSENNLNQEIYDFLRNQGEILEKISPKIIKDKYLLDLDFIEIKKLYETFLKTPGEFRIISKQGFIQSIKDGINQGLFVFGYLDNNNNIVFNSNIGNIALNDNEIIVKPELYKQKQNQDIQNIKDYQENYLQNYQQKTKNEVFKNITNEDNQIEYDKPKQLSFEREKPKEISNEKINNLKLSLDIPKGKMSSIVNIFNYLKDKFLDVKIEIYASNGELSKSEYEDKILETLHQAGIKIEKQEF